MIEGKCECDQGECNFIGAAPGRVDVVAGRQVAILQTSGYTYMADGMKVKDFNLVVEVCSRLFWSSSSGSTSSAPTLGRGSAPQRPVGAGDGIIQVEVEEHQSTARSSTGCTIPATCSGEPTGVIVE